MIARVQAVQKVQIAQDVRKWLIRAVRYEI
jgi:hypothetical protein